MIHIKQKVKTIIIVFFWLVLGVRPALATNSGPFSVDVWVYPTTSAASKAILGKSEELRIFTDASGYAGCQIKVTTWQTAATGSTALTINAWNHVACTYDKVNLKIFVNGVQMASQALTTVPDDTANAFKIGQDDSSGTTYANFTGVIDDFKFYNYARTQKQIVEDMNAGHPAVGSPVGSAVGYWKFDEGYGTTANNSGSQGTALNGTLTSMASPATATSGWTNSGKFGKGLVFDSTNDHVVITDNNALDLGTNPHTATAWIYLNSYGSYRPVVAKRSGGTVDFNYHIGDAVGDGKMASYNGTTSVGSTRTVSLSAWHQVVWVYDSGVVYFYLDGLANGSASQTSGAANSANVYIGQDNGTIPFFFNGSIDEVKIYNYALTSDEIKLDYNHGTALSLGSLSVNSSNVPLNSSTSAYCVPGSSDTCTAPVAEWKFDEGTGTSANDTSGNANTGTWNGTGSHWTPGKLGKAGKFNGSDDYVIGTTSISPGTGSFTSEAWFKTQTTAFSQFVSLSQYASDTLHKFFNLYIVSSTAKLGIRAYSEAQSVTAYDVQSSSAVNDNVWHHAAAVRNTSDNTLKLYLDGKLQGSLAIPANIDIEITSLPTIGAARDIYPSIIGNFLNGQIDQVRVYNYARTPAQIAYDYNRGGPVGHWKFDECQGTTVNSSNDPLSSSNSPLPGTITIGASGTQTSVGNCSTSATTAWYSGRTGKFNSSLNFDGTDDYVTTAAFSPLATAAVTTTKASWGGWFYPTSSAASLTLMEKASEFRLTTDASSKPVCGVSAASLATNLISYWKLEEASGSRADEVGGNTLADNNTVTGNPGKLGNAAQFTATNSEYLSIADNDSVSVTDQDFMFAAWVYLDSKPANYQIILSKRGTGYPMGDDYWLGWSNTADQFTFAVWSGASPSTLVGSVSATSFGTPSLATWYYVVAWHDSVANTVNISVNNGTTDSAATTGGPSNGATGPFMLGLHGGSTTRYWDGRIDSVGFWKRVLTSAERTDLYNGGTGMEATATFHDATAGSTALTTSAWNHVMCTYDGANIKTYLNGSLVGTTAETNNITAASSILYMGENSSGAQFVTGQIDDIQIFNYALTATQIKTLFNENSSVRFGPQTGSP